MRGNASHAPVRTPSFGSMNFRTGGPPEGARWLLGNAARARDGLGWVRVAPTSESTLEARFAQAIVTTFEFAAAIGVLRTAGMGGSTPSAGGDQLDALGERRLGGDTLVLGADLAQDALRLPAPADLVALSERFCAAVAGAVEARGDPPPVRRRAPLLGGTLLGALPLAFLAVAFWVGADRAPRLLDPPISPAT